eukprot:Blabericola_migrator_1__3742@NODE_211_length_11365_cov_144_425828_g181_i0_p6_GENE_NODE_211_length_11365_cov_144_425828_g181_i0NODE_211_length_11365_cov_144_425828_g181_i0_p6_ORF_typecomplete_len188_score27_46_NODE_211_length_11365_cov_144_425828_g181_i06491212
MQQPSPTPSNSASPAPIPSIVSHAPSRPAAAFEQQRGIPQLGDSHVRPPHFQGSPRPGETVAPTPTMFPITTEIYGTEPQIVGIEQEIPPSPGHICATPAMIELAAELDQKVKPLPVSPLPTPSVVGEPPRLTEADAEIIDIWFFRGMVPEEQLETDDHPGQLVEWKLLKQVGDNEVIPLTPAVPGG